ncbi:MAG: glycosyltransferase family 39 protein [Tepidisphaeraceae bacterium]
MNDTVFPTSSHHRRYLLLLLFVALAIRLGWAMTRPADAASVDQLPDQREYLETARNLLYGEGLGFVDPRFGQKVYAFRTPGYPAFLAACGANVRVARVVQAILDTGTVLAAYLLARRWLSKWASLFAALLVAFNPFLIYFCGLLLTETLFTAMLAWAMVLLAWPGAITSVGKARLAWIGGVLLLALAVLVRPGAIGLPVGLAVCGVLVNRRASNAYHLGSFWPLPVAATALLLTGLVLLPWAYRNHLVVGQWIWTSTNGGFTAYDGFNPDADGSSNQSFVQAMPQLGRMDEVGRSKYLTARARDYTDAHPGRVTELAIAKIARMWSPKPLSDDFGRPLYVAAALLYGAPFFLLVIVGVFSSPLPLSAKVFLLSPAVYLTVVHALSVGSLRYRVPAEVPMAVVAAGVVARVLESVRTPDWRRPRDDEDGDELDADGRPIETLS